MVKIDLITGFLGSGKTTFIKLYVQYLLKKGEKVCILENDYGAINVDTMLLGQLKSDQLGIEMVAGGCDFDCHQRRFKTKLITMAMLGYHRVIVEPSGIFDVDEFFDILQDDALYNRYKIDNVIAIVDANLEKNLSKQSKYMLASQVSCAGAIVLSKTQNTDHAQIENTIERINQALKDISCTRQFSNDQIVCDNWFTMTDKAYERIIHSGYQETGYVKDFSMDRNEFQSLFYMNCSLSKEQTISQIKECWKDEKAGNILRIKGFVKEEDQWYEINSTKESLDVEPISAGQKILIIIGEHLDEIRIGSYFPSEYSTGHESK